MTTSASSAPPPALWNPGAAACWSLLFTPVFGAWLHARNADALGRTAEARGNRIWIGVCLAYLVFVGASVFFPGIPEAVYRGTVVGLLIGWYVSVARPQILFVRERWQSDYPRKSWARPLALGTAALIGVIAADFGLVILAESLGAGDGATSSR